MKKFFTGKYIAMGIGLIIIVSIVVSAVRNGGTGDSELVTVARADIRQEVSITGSVKPAEDVSLAFETSGKIARVNVKVNDRVASGDVLAELDRGELNAQLASAQASVASALALQRQYQAALDAQQAKLDELKRGTRPEQIAVKQAELAKADQDLANYFNSVRDTVSDAYTSADDAIRVKIASLFQGSRTTSFSLTYQPCDYQAGTDASNLRMESDLSLVSWQAQIQSLSASVDKFAAEQALGTAKKSLELYLRTLERIYDTLQTNCSLSAANLTAYQSAVNTARASVVSALSTVNTLSQNIAAQDATVSRIRQELNLLLAGNDPQQISAQEAAVRQAAANLDSQTAQVKVSEANVQNIAAKISKTAIRAPFAGIVTSQDAKLGAIVAANSPIVSLITDSQYEIEANVPEVDIGKISISDSAAITLDAYGNDVEFQASIASIDPAETVIQGVIYYKVTLVFSQADARLKSGMTANVTILTDKRDNVLAIPARAVVEENSKSYVSVALDGDPARLERREVTLGLRGTGGLVEVTQGLSEGDRISGTR